MLIEELRNQIVWIHIEKVENIFEDQLALNNSFQTLETLVGWPMKSLKIIEKEWRLEMATHVCEVSTHGTNAWRFCKKLESTSDANISGYRYPNTKRFESIFKI